jgi:glycosyltransferase involved in cell wall biosynthesis
MISIITINYNNSNGLKKTLDSASQQTSKDFQHVIIDGGSSDDSRLVIAGYAHKNVLAVSEKDNGIYHAMNKGIGLSSGEYLLFLNSGDELFSQDTIDNCLKFEHQSQDLIIGMAEFKGNSGKRRLIKIESIQLAYFIQNSLPHPATFIRRDAFERFGFYDERLKISSDWKFFLNALYRCNASFVFMPETIAVFDGSGISSQAESQNVILEEKKEALRELFGDRVSHALILASKDRYLLESRRHKLLSKIEKHSVFGGLLSILFIVLSFIVITCDYKKKYFSRFAAGPVKLKKLSNSNG